MAPRSVAFFRASGGFERGFEAAGFDVQVAGRDRPRCGLGVEPDTGLTSPRYGDVKTRSSGADLEPVEAVIGGFPCQDLSGGRQARRAIWSQVGPVLAGGQNREERCVKRQTGAIQISLFSKMSQGCSSSHRGRDFAQVLSGLHGSGLLSDTASSTPDFSAFLNEGDECSSARASLADVLEPSVSQKYYLSSRAAPGILRRASRRGKDLPETLKTALESLAASASA